MSGYACKRGPVIANSHRELCLIHASHITVNNLTSWVDIFIDKEASMTLFRFGLVYTTTTVDGQERSLMLHKAESREIDLR